MYKYNYRRTTMAITKVITLINDDGIEYTDISSWKTAYRVPLPITNPVWEGHSGDEPTAESGVSWAYALTDVNKATRTFTFANQAALDAWIADDEKPSRFADSETPHDYVVKSLRA
jgi:hypothetical protein